MVQTLWRSSRAGYLLVLLAVGVLLFPALTQRLGRGDFDFVYASALRLQQGLPLYEFADFQHTKTPLLSLVWLPLTFLPRELVTRAWDVINVGLFPLVVWWSCRAVRYKPQNTLGVLVVALLFLFNPWSQEIRLGQYNLVSLALVLFSVKSATSMWAGVATAIAFLFKPSNLFFVPWAFKSVANKRDFSLGFLGCLVGLVTLFIWQTGWDRAWELHRMWLPFVDQVTRGHISRWDNFALLKAFDWYALHYSTITWVGLAAVVIFARYSRGKNQLLAASILMSLACNPLCWFQNFVILIFPLVWALSKGKQLPTRAARWGWKAAGGLLFIGTGLYSYTFCNLGAWTQAWCHLPVPTVFITLAVVVFFTVQQRGLRTTPKIS